MTNKNEINNKKLNTKWERFAPNQTLVHCVGKKKGMNIDSQEFCFVFFFYKFSFSHLT